MYNKNNRLEIEKDSLLQLVNAMTMSEKRYFTSQFNANPTIQFLPLFREMNESLKANKKTRGLGQIENAKHYSQLRNYLFGAIMKSLRYYHEENSTHNKLNNAIHEIDILINKELFKLARKKIVATRKLAKRYDSFLHVIQLNKLDSRVNTFYNKNSAERMELELTKDSALSADQAKTEIEFTRLFLEYRNRYFVDRDIDLDLLIDQDFPHLTRNVDEMSLKSTYYHYILLANHYIVKKEFTKALNELTTIKEIMEQDAGIRNNTNLDTITFFNYTQVLNNMTQIIASIDTKENFFKHLDKLKGLKSKSKRENNKLQLNIIISESDYYINHKMIQEGCSFALSTYSLLPDLDADPNRMEIAYFNLMVLLFYGGEFKLAGKLAQRNMEYKPFYKVLFRATLFVYIMCQYELKELQHGYYYIERFSKLLFRDKPTPFDNKVKLILSNLFSGKNENAKRNFTKFKDMLADDQFRKNQNVNLNLYVDFAGWLEKKMG